MMQGYSQKRVAKLLHLTDTSIISRWERGVTFPGLMEVFRLSRIYHARPEQLYDGLWQMVERDPTLLTHDESITSF